MTITERFVKERNDALFSLDRRKIEAYMLKYGEPAMSDLPDEVFWASVYKAICGITGAPKELKKKAQSWLVENGYGGIVWHGKYDLNTAELMDSITVKTTKRERARAKLVQLLEHEDRPAKEVYAGLADIGVGSRTVEKAKKELQVTTYRSGGSWYWSLPKPK